jgi:hypothetical protein
MKHAKHSKPLRVAQIALALLVALAASTAAGQAAPAPAGPSYGPVLHPQPVNAEPRAQIEQIPQAPQPQDPAKSQQRKDGKKVTNRNARRSAPLRVDPVAVAMTPSAPQPQLPTRPAMPDRAPVQINSCLGGTCTDTNGATYNTGVGNAAVNSQGRLCTRTANTMQCF